MDPYAYALPTHMTYNCEFMQSKTKKQMGQCTPGVCQRADFLFGRFPTKLKRTESKLELRSNALARRRSLEGTATFITENCLPRVWPRAPAWPRPWVLAPDPGKMQQLSARPWERKPLLQHEESSSEAVGLHAAL